MGNFEIKSDSFYIDGKPFRMFSGAMHYFRVLPEYWEDRLTKMKQAGFNTVETVMCWNLHEPKEGQFDFEGMLDIEKYAAIAQKLGMYIVVRPGPYTCAEWDFGGFPAWMLKDKNIRYRCDNAIYLEKVGNYFKKALAILKKMQIQNGGNLLAVQIENEYGSYGNDKVYLGKIEKMIRDNGITLPLFTSDGTNPSMISGGTLPHIYTTLNFGSRGATAFNCLEKSQPNMPKTCMEFWCGWFDHWCGVHHSRNPLQVGAEIKKLVDIGANINIYTFHGGTNFNFWAGANYYSTYRSTVTSYDDAALLNEYGDYTPAYHRVRDIFLSAQGLKKEELLPSPILQNVGEVVLSEQSDLFGNLEKISTRFDVSHPESMEYFDQNFGYILYRMDLEGHYEPKMLTVEGVRDVAYLYIDGKLVKSFNRNKQSGDTMTFPFGGVNGKCRIEILVEAMGRINYGPFMEDRKGISKVRLGIQTMFGWNVFTLPMDNLKNLNFVSKSESFDKPLFMKGEFIAKSGADCFVDMKGFKKGFVTVNGYNIGRYWAKGPQRSLYLPAPLLKEGKNEIIVFEQEGYKKPIIKITNKHYL